MITSPRNPRIAAAARLHKRAAREDARTFLVEGPQAIAAALDAGAPLQDLFVLEPDHELALRAREHGIPVHPVSTEAMERLSGTVTPQGLVATCGFIGRDLGDLPSGASCLAVLCDGRDPGNAGTVVRSADAAGADGVIFAGTSVDPYNAKTVRASAGSLFHVPVVRASSPAETVAALRARGLTILATAADGEVDLFHAELDGPVAFLFGNEAHGLAPKEAALADVTLRIPIWGKAESLNQATAAALCLYEAARAKGPALPAIIAGAAHDLRSPMAAARNFASLLLSHGDGMSEEDRRAMLEGIVHDAAAADLVIRQLIDAARLTAGRLELQRESVNVRDMVTEVAADAAFDPDHPGISWAGGEEQIDADPARLRASLAAMTEAALWWAREGDIQVTGIPCGVEVARAGALEPPGGLQSLFVPRRPGTGSGSKIGLYVARGVAREHGGDLAASVDGGALRFRLTLGPC